MRLFIGRTGRGILLVMDWIAYEPNLLMYYDICIYHNREKTNLYISVSNGVSEEQYVVLESLYLLIPLVSIFASIYIYIYIDVYLVM
jgi:hypothetical protein